MNNGLKLIFAFALGAAAGAVVTWKLVDEKHRQRADEEIEQMREFYDAKMNDEPLTDDMVIVEGTDEETDEEPEDDYEAMQKTYREKVKAYDRRVYGEEKKGGSENMQNEPYIISPDEYGEDFDVESLVYYADGILADINDNVISNRKSLVGSDFYKHFGEYEEDTVFIRNEAEEIDYEICRDTRTFSEAVQTDLTDPE